MANCHRRMATIPDIFKITAPANGESGAPALAVPSKKPSPKRSSPTTVTNTSGTETAPDWTAEQDAKLIELKTANKPWKEICSHIANKPIFEVKKRWGEIRPMSDAEKRKRDADKAKGDAKAAEGKANAAEGKGKGKGDGNQQDGKAKKRVSWANEITDSKEVRVLLLILIPLFLCLRLLANIASLLWLYLLWPGAKMRHVDTEEERRNDHNPVQRRSLHL